MEAQDVSVQNYFQHILPAVLKQRKKQAESLGVNIQFCVKGKGGGLWTLRLRPPHACVVAGNTWKPQLKITVTTSEMQNMLSGCFNVKTALQAGNIELDGDLKLIKAVGSLIF
jgi:hypothetical protein